MDSVFQLPTLASARGLLVLEPMHQHLDLSSEVLTSGSRCTIGSAWDCSVRLPVSSLIQPVHCVIDVIEHRAVVSHWAANNTWLNDRLITEEKELLAGDRIAVGPFDFQVRSAIPAELPAARTTSVETNLAKIEQAQSVTASPDSLESELTRKITRLIGGLQHQLLSLDERNRSAVPSDFVAAEATEKNVSSNLPVNVPTHVLVDDSHSALATQTPKLTRMSENSVTILDQTANSPRPISNETNAAIGSAIVRAQKLAQRTDSPNHELPKSPASNPSSNGFTDPIRRSSSDRPSMSNQQREQNLRLELESEFAQRNEELKRHQLELENEKAALTAWQNQLQTEKDRLSRLTDELALRQNDLTRQQREIESRSVPVKVESVSPVSSLNHESVAGTPEDRPTTDPIAVPVEVPVEPNPVSVSATSSSQLDRPLQLALTFLALLAGIGFFIVPFGDWLTNLVLGLAFLGVGVFSGLDLFLWRLKSN